MTIAEAISNLDATCRNTTDTATKISWLSQVDSIVQATILDKYKNITGERFTGYNADTPGDTVLLIPAPWDGAYAHYMEARIHRRNQEMDLCNNAMGMYYTDIENYGNHMQRTNIPKSAGARFLF